MENNNYNVVTRSSETAVTAGYHMNIVGFGWTNGVFLELLQKLPREAVDRLAKEQANANAAEKSSAKWEYPKAPTEEAVHQ